MVPIYIKATNACNLGCEHCYITPKNKSEEHRAITTEQVDIIIEKLKGYYEDEHIRIKWHGGEPLMAGIPLYKHILANHKKKNITHFLQTNLTLINDKWYPVIEKLFDGRIGTSFDMSRRAGGCFETFYAIWQKKYKDAKKHFDISVRMTVTSEMIQKSAAWVADIIAQLDTDIVILDYFFPNGTGKINEHKLFVTYYDYHAFTAEVKHLCLTKSPKTIVEVNNGIIKNTVFNNSREYFCSTCSENMLVIEPDGKTYNCIIMSGNKNNCLGNILNNSMEDIMYSEKRINHIIKHNSFYCDCEYYSNCNGGCYLQKRAIEKNKCKEVFRRANATKV